MRSKDGMFWIFSICALFSATLGELIFNNPYTDELPELEELVPFSDPRMELLRRESMRKFRDYDYSGIQRSKPLPLVDGQLGDPVNIVPVTSDLRIKVLSFNPKNNDKALPRYEGTVEITFMLRTATDEIRLHAPDDILLGEASYRKDKENYQAASATKNGDGTISISTPQRIEYGKYQIKVQFARNIPNGLDEGRRAGLFGIRTNQGDFIFTQFINGFSSRHIAPGFDDLAHPMSVNFYVDTVDGSTAVGSGLAAAEGKDFPRETRLDKLAVVVTPYDQKSTQLPLLTDGNDHLAVTLSGPPGVMFMNFVSFSRDVISILVNNSMLLPGEGGYSPGKGEKAHLTIVIGPRILESDLAAPQLVVVREKMADYDHCCSTSIHGTNVEEVAAQLVSKAYYKSIMMPEAFGDAWLIEAIALYSAYCLVPHNPLNFKTHLHERFSGINRAALLTGSKGWVSIGEEPTTDEELWTQVTSKKFIYKGAAILKMFDAAFPDNTDKMKMHGAIGEFLREHVNRLYNTVQFWGRMQTYGMVPPTGMSIIEAAAAWELEKSFPVLKVRCQDQTCIITQRPHRGEGFDTTWAVPIKYQLKDGVAKFVWFSPEYAEVLIATTGDDNYPILKVDGAGLYRVDYGPRGWEKNIERLQGQLAFNDKEPVLPSPATRLAFYTDIFDTYREQPEMTKQDYYVKNHVNDAMRFLKFERDFHNWKELLRLIMDSRASYAYYKDWDEVTVQLELILNFLVLDRDPMSKINQLIDKAKNEKDAIKMRDLEREADHNLDIVKAACYFNITICKDWAMKHWNNGIADCKEGQQFSECSKVNSLLRPFVYCVARTIGDDKTYELAKKAKDIETVLTEKYTLKRAFHKECIQPTQYRPHRHTYWGERSTLRFTGRDDGYFPKDYRIDDYFD